MPGAVRNFRYPDDRWAEALEKAKAKYGDDITMSRLLTEMLNRFIGLEGSLKPVTDSAENVGVEQTQKIEKTPETLPRAVRQGPEVVNEAAQRMARKREIRESLPYVEDEDEQLKLVAELKRLGG